MAVERLNSYCMSFPWTCFSLSLASTESYDITKVFVKTNLVQKIALTSTYDIIMSLGHLRNRLAPAVNC